MIMGLVRNLKSKRNYVSLRSDWKEMAEFT